MNTSLMQTNAADYRTAKVSPVLEGDLRPMEMVQARVVDLERRLRGIGNAIADKAGAFRAEQGAVGEAIASSSDRDGPPEPIPGSLPAIFGKLDQLEGSIEYVAREFDRIRTL